MGLGDAERPYLAMARMENRQGETCFLWQGKSAAIHQTKKLKKKTSQKI
jgi:hypothetical protein